MLYCVLPAGFVAAFRALQKLHETETDFEKRRVIERPLAEEELELAALNQKAE